jgi:hypothetical protein
MHRTEGGRKTKQTKTNEKIFEPSNNHFELHQATGKPLQQLTCLLERVPLTMLVRVAEKGKASG